MMNHTPYFPARNEWEEAYYMLCEHCANQASCDVVEGMIEIKDGGKWPSGGWVHDPGGWVSCLSYAARTRPPIIKHKLINVLNEAVQMCGGCAAQKGSEASVCLHTQRDFRQAVKDKALFICHEEKNKGKPCGGWANAIKQAPEE